MPLPGKFVCCFCISYDSSSYAFSTLIPIGKFLSKVSRKITNFVFIMQFPSQPVFLSLPSKFFRLLFCSREFDNTSITNAGHRFITTKISEHSEWYSGAYRHPLAKFLCYQGRFLRDEKRPFERKLKSRS